MNVNLCTDAKYHNLILMKFSAWHKKHGDRVWLNGVGKFDLSYGSWLFDFSEKVPCDIEGGPGITQNGQRVLGLHEHPEIGVQVGGFLDRLFPDYDLFPNVDYGLGYTYAFCPRHCPFCKVHLIDYPRSDKHRSIWEFHNPDFGKICLLNNNTFADPKWEETFEEIWDADLTVIDENGYDLRLIDEEKADALNRTKFDGYIHYAWDLMKDEQKVLNGLMIAPRGMVYVLIGFNTTQEENFYRCQKIHDLGHDPYVMPYNRTREERRFQRFINTRMYRKYPNIKEAWKDYQ